eukprot:SAG22_NODE_339_length_12034_cov_3.087474_5_plen_233_part_00
MQLHSGRLLACCDHSIDGQLDPYPIETNHAHVILSDDHGDSWRLGGIVGLHSSDECSVAQLSSGTVVMNIRNYIDGQRGGQIVRPGTTDSQHVSRALAFSTSAGETWGPVQFVAALPDPICFSDIMRVNASTHGHGHGHGGMGWPSSVPGDDLLLLSNPSSHLGRTNLSIHASLDGGVTWLPENAVVVEDRGKRASGYAHMVAMNHQQPPQGRRDAAGRPPPRQGLVGIVYV